MLTEWTELHSPGGVDFRSLVSLTALIDLLRPGSEGADLRAFTRECELRGVCWPAEVVEQFLFDHGKNPDFVEQYAHLDLTAIDWRLQAVTTEQLLEATYFDEFGGRVHDVENQTSYVLKQYQKAYGDDVWAQTWKRPPIFIVGALRQPPQQELHLVEGHTRLGVLRGKHDEDPTAVQAYHRTYVGHPAPWLVRQPRAITGT